MLTIAYMSSMEASFTYHCWFCYHFRLTVPFGFFALFFFGGASGAAQALLDPIEAACGGKLLSLVHLSMMGERIACYGCVISSEAFFVKPPVQLGMKQQERSPVRSLYI